MSTPAHDENQVPSTIDEFQSPQFIATQISQSITGEILQEAGALVSGIQILGGLTVSCEAKLQVLREHYEARLLIIDQLRQGIIVDRAVFDTLHQNTTVTDNHLSHAQTILCQAQEEVEGLFSQILSLKTQIGRLKAEGHMDGSDNHQHQSALHQPAARYLAESSEDEPMLPTPIPSSTEFSSDSPAMPVYLKSTMSPHLKARHGPKQAVPGRPGSPSGLKIVLTDGEHRRRTSGDILQTTDSLVAVKHRTPSEISRQLSRMNISPRSSPSRENPDDKGVNYVQGGSLTSVWAPKAPKKNGSPSPGAFSNKIDRCGSPNRSTSGNHKDTIQAQSSRPPRPVQYSKPDFSNTLK